MAKKEEMTMNKKAEQFQAYLDKNEMKFFQVQELQDEFHTVVFRSNIEVQGQKLPTIVITDDTIWTLIRSQIVAGAVAADKKAAIEEFLNGLNAKYKVFKFYVTEGNDINMDICVPTIPEQFDAEMVRSLLQISVEQLMELYPQIMEVVWGKK